MTGPSTPPAASALPKLRSGQLRAQVLAALAAEPDRVWVIGEVSHRLHGRSSGAIRGALQTLTTEAAVTQVSAAPASYQVTAVGLAAAAPSVLPPVPAPGTTLRRPKRTPAPGSTPPAPAGPTSALSAAQSVPPWPGAVQRPGGSWYRPRPLLHGRLDVEVLPRLRAEHTSLLLYGPPGTGKTSMVEAAFPDVITLEGNGDTLADDFLGSWSVDPAGGYVFSHGPMVTAMRQGRPFFVDDATLIPPRALAVTYPVMDGRGRITIPANRGERVEASDGFYVLMGINPGAHGAILPEALASRLALHIEVPTDFGLALSLGVPAEAVTLAEVLNDRVDRNELRWAPQLRELLGFARIAETFGLDVAAANLAGIAPEEDRGEVLALIQDTFGAHIRPLRVGDQR